MLLMSTLIRVDKTDFIVTVNNIVSRYWYKNGALRPDMITVFIAMDRCAKFNGGLQVCYFGCYHVVSYDKQETHQEMR